jgi:hypothetical protein
MRFSHQTVPGLFDGTKLNDLFRRKMTNVIKPGEHFGMLALNLERYESLLDKHLVKQRHLPFQRRSQRISGKLRHIPYNFGDELHVWHIPQRKPCIFLRI